MCGNALRVSIRSSIVTQGNFLALAHVVRMEPSIDLALLTYQLGDNEVEVFVAQLAERVASSFEDVYSAQRSMVWSGCCPRGHVELG